MEKRVAQLLLKSNKIAVLTGAGISAQSGTKKLYKKFTLGIPTFRGQDGYWVAGKNYTPKSMAQWSTFQKDPTTVWNCMLIFLSNFFSVYHERRNHVLQCKPNAAHFALAELSNLLKEQNRTSASLSSSWSKVPLSNTYKMRIITQNVDGLHERSGFPMSQVNEIHGNLFYMRHAYALINVTPVTVPIPLHVHSGVVYMPNSNTLLARPHVLWFDEQYNEAFYKYNSTLRFVESEMDCLIIIGTTLETFLPSRIADIALSRNVPIVNINTEKDAVQDLQNSKSVIHIVDTASNALQSIVTHAKQMQ